MGTLLQKSEQTFMEHNIKRKDSDRIKPSLWSTLKKNPEYWIASLSFLIRFFFLQILSSSPFLEPVKGGSDRALYDHVAQQMLSGHIFPSEVFQYMPLYPWCLGILYSLFNLIGLGSNLFGAGLFGVFIDSGTSFLIARTSRILGAPIWTVSVTGLIYAFFPTAIAYSVVTMPNTLNAFLVTLFIYVYLQKISKSLIKFESVSQAFAFRKFLPWFFLGILGGIVSLSFAAMILVMAACVLYWIISLKFNSQGILCSIFFLIGLSLPILPITLHNWRCEKKLVLITAHGGFVFFVGNNEDATGYPIQIGNFRKDAGGMLADAMLEAEKKEGRKLTAAEFSSHWSKRAWDFIYAHPLQEIKLLFLKLLKFWNGKGFDDIRLVPIFQITNLAFNSWLWPTFTWICWLGLIGLVLAPKNYFLKIFVLTASFTVILFFITDRYRLNFTPLLCILGALGLAEMIENLIHPKKGVRFTKNIGVFLGAGLVTILPLQHPNLRSSDYYNICTYLLQKEKFPEALDFTRKGISIAPNDANLFFAMGNAQYGLRRIEEAARCYQETLRLEPSHASAHFNLGQMFMLLGQPLSAAQEARAALQYDPQHPHAQELLVEAEEKSRELRATSRK
jgi:tetratricopeptide (TPR) repeat protein